jgi:large subunit ribosomal protein L25
LELLDLKAEIRETRGKSAARHLRDNDAVPAILYGSKTEPVSISVPTPDLITLIRKNGSSGLFIKLVIAGDIKPVRTVMLKELQTDTYGLKYLHVDFQEVDLDEKITITVPVEATGESVGVKGGGILQVIRRELDIVCRPGDMPETIVIDTSDLDMGDSVHVSEIDLGADIEIPHEVDFTVLTVVHPGGGAGDEEEGLEEEAVEEVSE